jgi:hypothetical protein
VAWAKVVINASMHCRVACFVEVWFRVADGKPVDTKSPLYDEVSNAIDYYLTRPPKRGAPPGAFEEITLAHIYLKPDREEPNLTTKRRLYAFVHKFKVANIIREFVNIQALINLKATEKFEDLQSNFFKEIPSVPYWKQKISQQRLPAKLQGNAQLAQINSYLKNRIREGKKRIARSNYPKLDLSLSDLAAFIATSGTLLLLLGYIHVFIVNSYFGIPYQQYFQASDYIASSVNGLAAIFLGAFLAAGYGFLFWSTISSYSTQSASLYAQSFSSRAYNWMFHVLGTSSLLSLATVYYFEQRIDALSFLGASLYVGIPLIAHFCVLFCSNPLRAVFLLGLVYIATMQTISDALREIERVLQIKSSAPMRTLEFTHGTYSEPEWYVLAVTSSFVIMRHSVDGAIRVVPKSDLKRIDNVPQSIPGQR